MENSGFIQVKLLSCKLQHLRFLPVLPVNSDITMPRIFVKKTVSQQASPTENLFPNKRTACLHTTTCHYNKEENLRLSWK
jgi:hypothetical protein